MFVENTVDPEIKKLLDELPKSGRTYVSIHPCPEMDRRHQDFVKYLEELDSKEKKGNCNV